MTVSLCMIVRDEAAALAKCLRSVAGIFDETILILTGANPKMRCVAEEFGADVHGWQWRDDFALARNASLEHASGDWVCWLDADEWLKPFDRAQLRRLCQVLQDQRCFYLFEQVSYGPSAAGQHATLPQKEWHPRVWRRLPAVAWEGRVHEQIMPVLAARGDRALKLSIRIQHDGYRDQHRCQQKLTRNVRLSQLETRDHPERAEAWFFLGRSLMGTSQAEEAKGALARAITLARAEDGWVGYAEHLLRLLEGGLPPCAAI